MLSESKDAIIQAVMSARLLGSASHHADNPQCTSTIPPIGRKSYILQLPQKDINKYFTHIFFRGSGIYLITICLKEMMRDPLVQFEKFCYWLRQVQTYVGPEDIKRVIVVGLHNTQSTDIAQSQKISSFVMELDQAIQEVNSKQIMETSRDGIILSLNLSDPDESIRYLCQYVDKCLDVMIEQSWCYAKDFYLCTFQPFTQLTSVVSKISKIKATVASTQDIWDCYNFSDAHYMKTLANYSRSCISPEGQCEL